MPKATLAGHATHVSREGESPQKAVLIHCALAHSGALAPLAARLEGLRSARFDMPGHGRAAPWNSGNYQDDVARMAEALCEGPTHLVGHSFGGTAALRLAWQKPELVASLTLIEPVFFAAARLASQAAFEAHERRFAPFVQAMEAGDVGKAAQTFHALWGGDLPWEALPAQTRAYVTDRVHLIPVSGASIVEDADRQLTHDRVGAIRAPVTLMQGAQTNPVIPAILRGLVTLMPQARICTVGGAGHMLPLTHPEAVAAEVRRHTQ